MNYPYSPITLPYEECALEPFLSQEIIFYHYCKHYQTYVKTLNSLLIKYPALQSLSLVELIMHLQNCNYAYQEKMLTAAGGVYNHQLYFKCLTPAPSCLSHNELYYCITKNFGSFNAFIDYFLDTANAFVGSGYIWLILNRKDLQVVTLPNQTTPLSNSIIPLLNIDLWEHSYYLQYKNKRDAYLQNTTNIINWDYVNQRYVSTL